MRIRAAAILAVLLAATASADDGLAPFAAEYDVQYGSIGVGTSRTELKRAPVAGQWIIESHSNASGFAKIIASGTLTQRSVFEAGSAGLRPLDYRFDDGTRRTGRDVALAFDWESARVRGKAEDESVDLAAPSGLQDAASIQARVQLALLQGGEPGTIDMIESDRVKRYHYTRLRNERLATALGELDTVVYRSARDNSSRETLFWFAPSLGYVMVGAEQRRDGKRAFQTYIRTFRSDR
jgi:hypothetical protein